jgi:hypothetical protein
MKQLLFAKPTEVAGASRDALSVPWLLGELEI